MGMHHLAHVYILWARAVNGVRNTVETHVSDTM